MQLEHTDHGTAVRFKGKGIAGWVMKTINDKWAYSVCRKETRGVQITYDSFEDALKALLKDI